MRKRKKVDLRIGSMTLAFDCNYAPDSSRGGVESGQRVEAGGSADTRRYRLV